MATISIKNSTLTAQINTLGAELFSLKNNQNREYIWEANPNYWGKHSPILFPIVGTLKDNFFEHEGQRYTLARHGFARELPFEVVKKEENSVTFSLCATPETLKKYPFDFELQLSYTLIGSALHLGYRVINNANTLMPFSIGGHPAFALPKSFESYKLAFNNSNTLTYNLLENGLLTNETKTIEISNNQLKLQYPLFEKDALVFKQIISKKVTLLEENKPLLEVKFDDFPSLGIWTLANAPFICIEPWFGYSDTASNSGKILEKEGIQLVQSKESFQANYTITVL